MDTIGTPKHHLYFNIYKVKNVFTDLVAHLYAH